MRLFRQLRGTGNNNDPWGLATIDDVEAALFDICCYDASEQDIGTSISTSTTSHGSNASISEGKKLANSIDYTDDEQLCNIIRQLIEKKGQIVHAYNAEGYTPLQLICSNPLLSSKSRIVKLIVNTSYELAWQRDDLQVNSQNAVQQKSNNEHGCMVLHIACLHGSHIRTDIVEFLLESNPVGVCMKDDKYNNLPLHNACLAATANAPIPGVVPLELVLLLVQRWPDSVQEKNANGELPLHIAAYVGTKTTDGAEESAQLDIVQYLAEYWPNAMFVQNFNGQTPYQVARLSSDMNHALENRHPIVKFLKEFQQKNEHLNELQLNQQIKDKEPKNPEIKSVRMKKAWGQTEAMLSPEKGSVTTDSFNSLPTPQRANIPIHSKLLARSLSRDMNDLPSSSHNCPVGTHLESSGNSTTIGSRYIPKDNSCHSNSIHNHSMNNFDFSFGSSHKQQQPKCGQKHITKVIDNFSMSKSNCDFNASFHLSPTKPIRTKDFDDQSNVTPNLDSDDDLDCDDDDDDSMPHLISPRRILRTSIDQRLPLRDDLSFNSDSSSDDSSSGEDDDDKDNDANDSKAEGDISVTNYAKNEIELQQDDFASMNSVQSGLLRSKLYTIQNTENTDIMQETEMSVDQVNKDRKDDKHDMKNDDYGYTYNENELTANNSIQSKRFHRRASIDVARSYTKSKTTSDAQDMISSTNSSRTRRNSLCVSSDHTTDIRNSATYSTDIRYGSEHGEGTRSRSLQIHTPLRVSHEDQTTRGGTNFVSKTQFGTRTTDATGPLVVSIHSQNDEADLGNQSLQACDQSNKENIDATSCASSPCRKDRDQHSRNGTINSSSNSTNSSFRSPNANNSIRSRNRTILPSSNHTNTTTTSQRNINSKYDPNKTPRTSGKTKKIEKSVFTVYKPLFHEQEICHVDNEMIGMAEHLQNDGTNFVKMEQDSRKESAKQRREDDKDFQPTCAQGNKSNPSHKHNGNEGTEGSNCDDFTVEMHSEDDEGHEPMDSTSCNLKGYDSYDDVDSFAVATHVSHGTDCNYIRSEDDEDLKRNHTLAPQIFASATDPRIDIENTTEYDDAAQKISQSSIMPDTTRVRRSARRRISRAPSDNERDTMRRSVTRGIASKKSGIVLDNITSSPWKKTQVSRFMSMRDDPLIALRALDDGTMVGAETSHVSDGTDGEESVDDYLNSSTGFTALDLDNIDPLNNDACLYPFSEAEDDNATQSSNDEIEEDRENESDDCDDDFTIGDEVSVIPRNVQRLKSRMPLMEDLRRLQSNIDNDRSEEAIAGKITDNKDGTKNPKRITDRMRNRIGRPRRRPKRAETENQFIQNPANAPIPMTELSSYLSSTKNEDTDEEDDDVYTSIMEKPLFDDYDLDEEKEILGTILIPTQDVEDLIEYDPSSVRLHNFSNAKINHVAFPTKYTVDGMSQDTKHEIAGNESDFKRNTIDAETKVCGNLETKKDRPLGAKALIQPLNRTAEFGLQAASILLHSPKKVKQMVQFGKTNENDTTIQKFFALEQCENEVDNKINITVTRSASEKMKGDNTNDSSYDAESSAICFSSSTEASQLTKPAVVNRIPTSFDETKSVVNAKHNSTIVFKERKTHAVRRVYVPNSFDSVENAPTTTDDRQEIRSQQHATADAKSLGSSGDKSEEHRLKSERRKRRQQKLVRRRVREDGVAPDEFLEI